jgi:hypothetical protein
LNPTTRSNRFTGRTQPSDTWIHATASAASAKIK